MVWIYDIQIPKDFDPQVAMPGKEEASGSFGYNMAL